MGLTHLLFCGPRGRQSKERGVTLTLRRRQPIVLTVVWLVEKLLNGQLPGQKEVGEGLAWRAVLQEHDSTQGFCYCLVRDGLALQQGLALLQDGGSGKGTRRTVTGFDSCLRCSGAVMRQPKRRCYFPQAEVGLSGCYRTACGILDLWLAQGRVAGSESPSTAAGSRVIGSRNSLGWKGP